MGAGLSAPSGLTKEGAAMKTTVRDIDVKGKRVLLRTDFNVPLGKDGQVSSDLRIRATLPTIEYLLGQSARIIMCSHMGRPKGKDDQSARLGVVAAYLSRLLSRPVHMAKDCVGPEVEAMAGRLKDGELLMLENLRFHSQEEANDDDFARSLARLADVYVNDAFGASHRAHASIVGVPRYIPGAEGLLMHRELEVLGSLLSNPAHPFGGLFGGAKVSDKSAMLHNIMPRLETLLIGGAMAALFLKARGYEIGRSKVEIDRLNEAAELTKRATETGRRLLLPVDVLVTTEMDGSAPVQAALVEAIPAQTYIVDIGPRTVELFKEELRRCRTIIWNGPMGIFEVPAFAAGSTVLARHIAGLNATTVMAGGSTAQVVESLGLADKMSFVSTGGGASLSYLAGESMPGVEALLEAVPRKLVRGAKA